MKSKEKLEEKISLESINKELNSLKKKIEKLPDKKETERFFHANLFLSFTFVLLAIVLPIVMELQDMSKEFKVFIVIVYTILLFGFIFIAGKFLKGAVNK